MAHHFIAKMQKSDMHVFCINWYAHPYCCVCSTHLPGVRLTIDSLASAVAILSGALVTLIYLATSNDDIAFLALGNMCTGGSGSSGICSGISSGIPGISSDVSTVISSGTSSGVSSGISLGISSSSDHRRLGLRAQPDTTLRSA